MLDIHPKINNVHTFELQTYRMRCISTIAKNMIQHHFLLANIACFIAFTVQFGNVFVGNIWPQHTNTHMEEKKLLDIDFPVIFKICVRPGFNSTAFWELGYKRTPWQFFTGRSRFNSSIYGWAGHTNQSGVQGTVQEVVDRVRMHKVKDVLKKIILSTVTHEGIFIDQSNVTIWRINYPFNCYTLDLTNNTDVKEKGVQKLIIVFHILQNLSLEILLQDKNLATNRNIQYHKLYFSGDAIKMQDLGESCVCVGVSYCWVIIESIKGMIYLKLCFLFLYKLNCTQQYMANSV